MQASLQAHFDSKFTALRKFYQPLLIFDAHRTPTHHSHLGVFTPTAGLPIRWTLGRRWDNVITRSNFKSEALLGFLSPNYTGHVT